MTLLQTIEQRPLVCDGAMGTLLQARGMPLDVCPEVWGIENAEVLLEIHREYLDAGADVILTSSLGGNSFKLKKYGVTTSATEIARGLAEIALKATGPGQHVLGDVGPTGDFMQPLGLATEDDFYQAFLAQCQGFADAGVAGIIVETMMDLNEAKVAVRAAKDTGLPVIGSLSFNPDPNGFRTMMGVSPEATVTGLLEAGADVIGTNCGSVLMEQMPELIGQFKKAGAPYVLVEANAGLPEIVEGRTVFGQTPAQMGKSIESVLKAGANIVGGCCGTTPAHIRCIADIVKGDLR